MYWKGFNWAATMLTSKRHSPETIRCYLNSLTELDDFYSGMQDAVQGFVSMTDAVQVG